MHKSYYTVLPSQNKFLQMKWDKYVYDEHRRKVKGAQSTVDTKPPTIYWHQHFKTKKLQLEEERLAQIERENRILLEKMACIMRTKGRIDNVNNYEARSLNHERRRRELIRVTRENMAIMNRILRCDAEYSREQWQSDWSQNLTYMDNISHYPPNWWLRKEFQQRQRTNLGSDSQRSGRKTKKAKKEDKEGSEKGKENASEEPSQNGDAEEPEKEAEAE